MPHKPRTFHERQYDEGWASRFHANEVGVLRPIPPSLDWAAGWDAATDRMVNPLWGNR